MITSPPPSPRNCSPGARQGEYQNRRAGGQARSDARLPAGVGIPRLTSDQGIVALVSGRPRRRGPKWHAAGIPEKWNAVRFGCNAELRNGNHDSIRESSSARCDSDGQSSGRVPRLVDLARVKLSRTHERSGRNGLILRRVTTGTQIAALAGKNWSALKRRDSSRDGSVALDSFRTPETLISNGCGGRDHRAQCRSQFREDAADHERCVEGLPRNCRARDRTAEFPEDGRHREGGLEGLPRNCRARDRTPKFFEDGKGRERGLQGLPRNDRSKDQRPMPRVHQNQSADPLAVSGSSPPYDGVFSRV